MMKLPCDPFFRHLLVALALYAGLLALWMHAPLSAAPTAPPAASVASSPLHAG